MMMEWGENILEYYIAPFLASPKSNKILDIVDGVFDVPHRNDINFLRQAAPRHCPFYF
jgi:hypothetical protein